MARKFKIQLRRDTAANWTSANPTLAAGECGVETDTGSLKIGDGTTAWNALGYAGGSPGADGAAGPTGPMGYDGDEGEQGYPIPGPQGIQGPTGSTGAAGADGAAGATGATGATGSIGPMGYDGEQGDDGYPIPGPVGATGAAGSNGSAGATGAAGAAGPPGMDGEDGGADWPLLGPAIGPAGGDLDGAYPNPTTVWPEVDASPTASHTVRAGMVLSVAGLPLTIDSGVVITVAAGGVLTIDPGGTNVHDVIPAGIIVMWGGTIATIPTGWNLCDGTLGTPDLSDRFIVGEVTTPGSGGGTVSPTAALATHATHSTHSTHAALATHQHTQSMFYRAAVSAANMFASSSPFGTGVNITNAKFFASAGSDTSNIAGDLVSATSGGTPDAHSAHDAHDAHAIMKYYKLAFIQKA